MKLCKNFYKKASDGFLQMTLLLDFIYSLKRTIVYCQSRCNDYLLTLQ